VINRDEGQWLSYAEAGRVLGISPEAARQLARRRGWPRRTPNEHNAPARVLVPDDAAVRPRPGMSGGQPPYERGPTGVRVRGTNGTNQADAESAVRAFEAAVAALTVQLDRERSRVDRAERQLEDERKLGETLREALADAQAAERITADGAAALRALIDDRRSWNLLRRLRWALRGH
jgi:hypothetical protein